MSYWPELGLQILPTPDGGLGTQSFFSGWKFTAQLKIALCGRDRILRDNEKFLPQQSSLSEFSLKVLFLDLCE